MINTGKKMVISDIPYPKVVGMACSKVFGELTEKGAAG
jgi:hypothetical protein